MPRKEGVKYLPITLSDSAQEHLKTFAATQGFNSAADYVRSLIEADMKSKGDPIDFGITKWGEGRKKTPNAQP